MQRNMTKLCLLARKHRTDKGGRHLTYGNHTTEICHEYTPVYSRFFAELVIPVKRVLEIGVNQGCSLRMWEEFFPEAEIYGLDIDQGCLFNEGRIKCFQADQSRKDSLLSVVEKMGGGTFDVIIDDGSHDPEHQKTSMQVLTPFLTPGGLYFIEDLHDDAEDRLHAARPDGFSMGVVKCSGGLGRAAEQEEKLVVLFHA